MSHLRNGLKFSNGLYTAAYADGASHPAYASSFNTDDTGVAGSDTGECADWIHSSSSDQFPSGTIFKVYKRGAGGAWLGPDDSGDWIVKA